MAAPERTSGVARGVGVSWDVTSSASHNRSPPPAALRQALRRSMQPALAALLENAWAPALRLAGAWLRRRPAVPAADWQPARGCVVVLAPHPDDETFGCGGTLLRHRAAGDDVHVLCATDGRRSRAQPVSPPEMARVRAREAAAACAILDVRLHWLDWPEGAWETGAAVAALRAALERLRPSVLYAPSWIDFHPEHWRVAQALALALRGGLEPAPPCLRVYALQVPLTPAWAGRVCEVSAQAETLARAVRAYASQWHSLARAWRQRRHAARLHGRGRLLEEFCDLTPDEYADCHVEPPETWARGLRGLRHTPFDDPWVYWRVWRLAHAARREAPGQRLARCGTSVRAHDLTT